ncbi:IS3 family transposase, partial [Streptomyces murinus]
SLVTDAPRMTAVTLSSPDGPVFHSDHGAPHGSRALAGLCNQPGATRPTGTVGTSADNTARESFHTSLKRETLQGAHDYGDPGTCRKTAPARPAHNNTHRRHSANSHLSPNEYERRHHTAKPTLPA